MKLTEFRQFVADPHTWRIGPDRATGMVLSGIILKRISPIMEACSSSFHMQCTLHHGF